VRQVDFEFPVTNPPKRTYPYFPIGVPAGFPSPAQDYIAKRIDLNELVIKHPGSTFYVRADGDSMFPDIADGDYMVIDRVAEITTGNIVLFCLNNEFGVKKYFQRPDGSVELVPTNPEYETINLPDECEFEIWGKVIWSFKPHK
jgi:DNA polymerase V